MNNPGIVFNPGIVLYLIFGIAFLAVALIYVIKKAIEKEPRLYAVFMATLIGVGCLMVYASNMYRSTSSVKVDRKIVTVVEDGVQKTDTLIRIVPVDFKK